MASGDGLIVRVHASARWLSSGALRDLAELSERHGNGLIEVTRRANLQLRGARESSIGALQAALCARRLAPENAEEERQNALIATPLLGLDARCAPLEPVLRALGAALSSSRAPARLHPKLAIVLDGPDGELSSLPADLYIAPSQEHPQRAALHIAAAPNAWLSAGELAFDDVCAWVLEMLERFAQASPEALRAQTWAARHGHALSQAVVAHSRTNARMTRWLGFQQEGSASWFGVSLPFGSGDTAQWRAIAQLADDYGDGLVRAHPARGLLLSRVDEGSARALRDAALALGLLVSHDDPLARAIACSGAPACGSAWGETRALARELVRHAAPALASGATLHVSGCEKSCAHSGASAIAIVHTREGLRLAFDGSAQDAASAAPRTRAELSAELSARARECATSADAPGEGS